MKSAYATIKGFEVARLATNTQRMVEKIANIGSRKERRETGDASAPARHGDRRGLANLRQADARLTPIDRGRTLLG